MGKNESDPSNGHRNGCGRPPSGRQLDDAQLTECIRAELVEQGTPIARKRVACLMRQARLHGVSRRWGFVVTTRRDARQRLAPDLVKREFKAEASNSCRSPA